MCITFQGKLIGKKREEMRGSKTNMETKNPSVAGTSTSSTTSTEEEEDDDESNENEDDEDEEGVTSQTEDALSTGSTAHNPGYISFASLFPATNVVTVPPPPPADLQLYRSMASLSKLSGPPMFTRKVSLTALPHPLARGVDTSLPCPIPVHDYESCLLKPISKESREIYENHVRVGREGPGPVKPESLELYTRYVSMAGIAA